MVRNERVAVAYARLGAVIPLVAISALLALVPFRTCLFWLMFKLPCPTCGYTRATLRLLQGDLWGSFLYHPMAIPGAVGFCIAVALALWLPQGHPAWRRFERVVMCVGAVSFLVVWVLRLAGVLPPV